MNEDYIPINTTREIPSNVTSFTIPFEVIDDDIVENDENFIVELRVSGDNVSTPFKTSTVTIKNDDG